MHTSTRLLTRFGIALLAILLIGCSGASDNSGNGFTHVGPADPPTGDTFAEVGSADPLDTSTETSNATPTQSYRELGRWDLTNPSGYSAYLTIEVGTEPVIVRDIDANSAEAPGLLDAFRRCAANWENPDDTQTAVALPLKLEIENTSAAFRWQADIAASVLLPNFSGFHLGTGTVGGICPTSRGGRFKDSDTGDAIVGIGAAFGEWENPGEVRAVNSYIILTRVINPSNASDPVEVFDDLRIGSDPILYNN